MGGVCRIGIQLGAACLSAGVNTDGGQGYPLGNGSGQWAAQQHLHQLFSAMQIEGLGVLDHYWAYNTPPPAQPAVADMPLLEECQQVLRLEQQGLLPPAGQGGRRHGVIGEATACAFVAQAAAQGSRAHWEAAAAVMPPPGAERGIRCAAGRPGVMQQWLPGQMLILPTGWLRQQRGCANASTLQASCDLGVVSGG